MRPCLLRWGPNGRSMPMFCATGSICETSFYAFGLGGGKSRAGHTDSNPTFLWEPSQKGLFSEAPQRHSPIDVRPAMPNSFPSASWIVNSPSRRIDPLLNIVTFAGITTMLADRFSPTPRM